MGGGALTDRRVVLCGCASDTGRATALLFAEEGARLILADADPAGERLAEAVRELGGEAYFEVTDLSSAEDVERLHRGSLKRFGGVDVVVSNVGARWSGAIADVAAEDWERLMAGGPRSCFLAAKYAIPILIAEGGGALVNLACRTGPDEPPVSGVDLVWMGAIVALTKSLAAEVEPWGIRVNAVCPGWSEPRRPTVPAEIAAASLFLASDASGFMSGQALAMDGVSAA